MWLLTPMIIEVENNGKVAEKILFIDFARNKVYSPKSHNGGPPLHWAVDVTDKYGPVVEVIRQRTAEVEDRELPEEVIEKALDTLKQKE